MASNGLVRGTALAFFVCLLVLLWRALPLLPQEGWFGWANSVTLLRSSWLCWLMAEGLLRVTGQVPLVQDQSALWLAGLAAAFLLLDGLDGWLARHLRAETEYGARFDNEVDGLFVMAVSLLLLAQGSVAGWLVVAGAARYGFLLAGRLYPALAVHLPERKKHKTVFVVFSILLIWGLWPGWTAWVGQAVSLSALIYLLGSFALDLRWLVLRRS
ncbi:CDP-alcohol phosphatidyltransferase family protein [Rhodovibrionaceae bacterium A322]